MAGLGEGFVILGVRFEFVLFGATLLAVALVHPHTLRIALIGLAAVVLYKLGFTGFESGPGLAGLGAHLRHEWVLLANLFGLLTGFALLSHHFAESNLPALLPRYLPHGWQGAFALLAIVFVLSSFLDNIAAALVGGTMAGAVYRRRLHVGYIAAIVAASNAGGAGSVVGDTTTTMMWIDGVSALEVTRAYVAAVTALVVGGLAAARQQHRYAPMETEVPELIRIDAVRLVIVALILVAAIAANVTMNLTAPELGERFPVIGAAVWGAILLGAPFRRPAWPVMPMTMKGSLFLLALVASASLMPVDDLPAPAWHTALGLGFLSAVFDNIPLTALALEQGGYDWAMLAYAVGYGGSMIWFGSSAGVALATVYRDAQSTVAWLRDGWHVALAYVIGFLVMLAMLGWHPSEKGWG